jgi:hypothetical protein
MLQVETSQPATSPDRETPKETQGEFLEFGPKRMQALMLMQAQYIDAVERASLNWCGRARRECGAVAELATQIAAARTVFESATLFQGWMTRQLQTLAGDSQTLTAECQKFWSASAKMMAENRTLWTATSNPWSKTGN